MSCQAINGATLSLYSELLSTLELITTIQTVV